MTENIYPSGTEVYAKSNPEQKLVVRRYVKRVYYCTIQQQPGQKELVFYKREINTGSPVPAAAVE